MVRWLRWHCPPDTGFEIRGLAVWGRALYFSVTEAPHKTDFTRGWGRNIFVSFKPPRPGTEPRTLAWKAAVLTTTLGPISLPVVGFRTQLGAGFSEKYHVSPLPILRLCFHVVSSGNVHFTLKCFTWLSWHWPYVGSMSDQCRRRWPNIEPIEGQHLVFLGMADNSKITKLANWQ